MAPAFKSAVDVRRASDFQSGLLAGKEPAPKDTLRPLRGRPWKNIQMQGTVSLQRSMEAHFEGLERILTFLNE